MILHSMGINLRHDENFQIDRPSGSGDNLFLIFKTEADILFGEAVVRVKPGCCILYKKGSPQRYRACQKEYRNHYVHFDGMEANFTGKIDLPCDTPLYLENLDEVETLLKLLSREQISVSELRKDNESLFLQLMLRKVAENKMEEKPLEGDKKHLEELKNLRSEIYSTPGSYRSIREMAEAVNLSLSHFQALYSEYFHVSCYEDLINARLAGAKEFLRQSDMSVREIASLCGYESDTCFMRCFKNRVKMTPSEFRAKVRNYDLF